MGWAPLPPDALLDHEHADQPGAAVGPTPGFAPLPADAARDDENAPAAEAPQQPDDAALSPTPLNADMTPIVITGQRHPAGKDVTQRQRVEALFEGAPP